jgi:hypothetical protein
MPTNLTYKHALCPDYLLGLIESHVEPDYSLFLDLTVLTILRVAFQSSSTLIDFLLLLDDTIPETLLVFAVIKINIVITSYRESPDCLARRDRGVLNKL